jgi:hypothetical protein
MRPVAVGEEVWICTLFFSSGKWTRTLQNHSGCGILWTRDHGIINIDFRTALCGASSAR